jgi:hypothetical protein
VKDRAAARASASIAATEFGLPSFAIGAERNWISRKDAAQITLNILRFFANSNQSADTNATGYKGFYYHFIGLETGTRTRHCELSSIDTGILMMGIIFARNYYDQANATETEIRNLAAFLLGRLEWDFFLMNTTDKFNKTLSMGFTPEQGVRDFGWAGYSEGLFLYILAAGTGMENVEESHEAWLKTYKWQTPYEGLSHVAFPPLFGHQFSHSFIDFRGLGEKYMKS